MQAIAEIQMQEGGVIRCQMPEEGADGFQLGDACLFEADYGLDSGSLVQTRARDPDAKPPGYRLLRRLAEEDEARLKMNADLAQKARHAFLLSVRYEKTPVKVLHTRFSFGGERLFIRYSAAAAVDLRRFVNQLQRDYKTQVDLWQVNAREDTAFVGCIGICGRVACCRAWQRQFPALSTRMAKAQDVALSPVSANGCCGRLKCCLAFEHGQYGEAGRDFPELGSLVRCTLDGAKENGTVIDRRVMCGRLTVRTRDGRLLKLMKDDVTLVRPARTDDRPKGDEHEDSVGEWSEP